MTGTPEWRARLAKVLGLLSSPHDGERVAAAGLTWDAVLTPPPAPRVVVMHAAPRPPMPDARTHHELLRMVRILQRWPDLTSAEVGFLGDAYRRLYREPHRGLDAGMARALDRMWRKHMTRAAA